MEKILTIKEIIKLLKDDFNYTKLFGYEMSFDSVVNRRHYEEACFYLESMITRYLETIINETNENVTFNNSSGTTFIVEVDDPQNLITCRDLFANKIEEEKNMLLEAEGRKIKNMVEETSFYYDIAINTNKIFKTYNEKLRELDRRKKDILDEIDEIEQEINF